MSNCLNFLLVVFVVLAWTVSTITARPRPGVFDESFDIDTGRVPMSYQGFRFHNPSSNDIPLCPCPVPLMQTFNTFNFSVKSDRFEFERNKEVWNIMYESLVFATDMAPRPFTITFGISNFGVFWWPMPQEMKAEIDSRLITPAQRCFTAVVIDAQNRQETTVSFQPCFLEVSGLGKRKNTNDEPPCKKRKPDDDSCNESGQNTDKDTRKKNDEASNNMRTAADESENKSDEPVKKCYFSKSRINVELEKKERPMQSFVTTDCDSTLTAYVMLLFVNCDL